jgi:hypothetical protein
VGYVEGQTVTFERRFAGADKSGSTSLSPI